MSDGAGKLDKLARLKNLKSGLKAKSESSGDDMDDLSLDADFGETVAAAPEVAARSAAAPPSDSAPPSPEKSEPDAESLSAYFEALGIVPDGAKLAGATGMPPKPYAPPSNAYTNPAEVKGRDIDARDRWPDPVREDDAFLSSFAGVAKPEESEDEEDLSLESIIGSFDDDDSDAVKIDPIPEDVEESTAVDDRPLDEGSDEEPSEAEPSIADLAAEELAEAPAPAPEISEDPEAEPDPEFEPFGKAVDIEAFEKEIGLSDSGPEPSAPLAMPVEEEVSAPPVDEASTDQPLSITFDETRATLLAHVSKQMNCSIDDVVVTAIDWYLDALFGEDDPEMGAGTGE